MYAEFTRYSALKLRYHVCPGASMEYDAAGYVIAVTLHKPPLKIDMPTTPAP